MLTGHNVADIVVILKTLPTKLCVGALGNKILEDLKKSNASEGMSSVVNCLSAWKVQVNKELWLVVEF